MPNSEMNPMMAGMLRIPSVKNMANTPPMSASGRFSSTTSDCEMFLNSPYRSIKMMNILNMLTRAMVLDALSSLSNCPPYSIW